MEDCDDLCESFNAACSRLTLSRKQMYSSCFIQHQEINDMYPNCSDSYVTCPSSFDYN